MTIRSKLFATVALPVLSATIGLQPALAEVQYKPFQIAQAEVDAGAADGGGASEEELLKKRRAERRAQREQQGEQEQSGDDAAKPSREERIKAREERRRQQEQNADQGGNDQKPAGDDAAKPSREERIKAREERRRQQEQNADQGGNDQKPAAADDGAAQQSREERIKAREERRRQQQQNAGQDGVGEGADDAAKSREERIKAREERRRQQEQSGQGGVGAGTADKAAPADAAAPAEGQSREERLKAREERRRQQQQDGVGFDSAPADDSAQDRPRDRKPIADKRTREEKEQLARDPSKSDDTVVLPVENGAAVLDSDKDADNRGGQDARERRRAERIKAREERRQAAPTSDAEAQSELRERRPSRDELRAAIEERGTRIDRVPEYDAQDFIEGFGDRRRPRIEEGRNNRIVLDFGDEVVVRGDDRPRLRRDARDSYYEELGGGRTREVIERANGVRVVTIYNRYGDIVQRSRINPDGREVLMVYAPDVDGGDRPPVYDVGEDLPPMRLTVPVEDYIIDTSTEPDRDYYAFLSEPPVERVERTYSIDEVRNSARLRDKVRRVDLDTLTFATGSAEVPQSQTETLRRVADAMLEVIDKDPGETFLIEGHTDAVGSDQSNLILSDERAESVASLLTEDPAGKPGHPGLWRALPQGAHGRSRAGKPPRHHPPRHPTGAPGGREVSIRRSTKKAARQSPCRAVCRWWQHALPMKDGSSPFQVAGRVSAQRASTKSAMAAVSLRSKTARPGASTGWSAAMARICGSVGASGVVFFASSRLASIFGIGSRL